MKSVLPTEQAYRTKLLAPIAAAKFPPSRYAVHLNLNGEQSFAIGGLYPDIVALRRRDGQIAAIAAVETEDSLTRARMVVWRDCAVLGYPFYLFVPALAYSAARDLLLRNGIAVKQLIVYRYENGILKLV